MKVGLVTLYRGYNYGTSLQAYALKHFISSLGYETEIIWLAEGANKGRDIRFAKIVKMLWRCLCHPQLFKHTFLSYKNSLSKPISPIIKTKFLEFTNKELNVKGLSAAELRAFATDKNTLAVVCGSDQIWNVAAANIEPMYFLRFAPEHKRVAYAPSLGGKKVPPYNKKILTTYIREIPFVSVREKSGTEIVKNLTDRHVPVLIDPTLLLDWDNWTEKPTFDNYIVAYFLDEPTSAALESLKQISRKNKCEIIAFPYEHTAYRQLNNIRYYPAGPKEFVGLIKNAKCVLTDSFHGTIFSVNLQTPFWTFERNYASGKGQNDRIVSILEKMGLSSRYIEPEGAPVNDISADEEKLKNAKSVIIQERKISLNYLQNALQRIGVYSHE